MRTVIIIDQSNRNSYVQFNRQFIQKQFVRKLQGVRQKYFFKLNKKQLENFDLILAIVVSKFNALFN
jgi:hypothetical protein